MARGGRGDRILPSGRVRTAAGGTRNRGGGLAVVGGRAPTVRPDTRTDFSTFSRSGRMRGQGVFRDGVSRARRTITAGGGATRAALPAAGGTGRGATARPDTRTDFSTFSRSGRMRGQGVFRDGVSPVRRTITAGGGATRAALPPAGGTGRGASAPGGTGGLVRVGNDPYRKSSAIVILSQAGAEDTRRRFGRRRRPGSPNAGPQRPTNAGGRDPDRREAAIRELARRGGTPGERAAARAAAERLGIRV